MRALQEQLAHTAGHRHELVPAPHGCKYARVGPCNLVRVIPERLLRRARGTSAPPPPPSSRQDMSSVRLRQLREAARHLLDKGNLRVGVVCATEHVLDHAPWDQDDEPWHTLREPLQVAGASLVTLPALSDKEARQVARSHADAAAASSGAPPCLSCPLACFCLLA